MKSRITIWGLGETGLAVARSVLKDPGLQIVGIFDNDQKLQGQDLGELLGTEPVGLTVNTDDAVFDCKADCVIVAPSGLTRHGNVTLQIARLLESGRNVISTLPCFESEPDVEAIRQACKQGCTSFHATGLFPQLLLQRFALTLGKALQRIDHIRLVQSIDCLQAPPDLLREVQTIGLGGPPDKVEHLIDTKRQTIATEIDLVAHALFGKAEGIRVEKNINITSARKRISCARCPIAKGDVAAISLIHRAWRGNVCFFSCEQYWYVGNEYQPAAQHLPYERRNTSFNFSVRVEGDPGALESQIEFDPAIAGISPLAHVAAQGVLAALQPVIAAEPGMLVSDASPQYQLDDRLPLSLGTSGSKRASNRKSRYRVVIWGPGEIGGAVTRAALQRDNIDIVGAKVFSPHKHGKDLGELVGIEAIGVAATTSKDAIKALKPDCIIVTPQPRAITEGMDDDVLELLESGINVITSAAYHNVTMPNWLTSAQTPTALLNEVANTTGMGRNWLEDMAFSLNARAMHTIKNTPLRKVAPPILDRLLTPAVRKAMPFRATPEKILRACLKGGASLHGTGVHPTFMAERIGIQLAAMVEEPQHMRFVEAADFSYMPDGMWGGLNTLGFGLPVDQLDERYLVARAGDFYYGDVTGNVAHLLFGVPNNQVRLERSFRALPAERDFKVGSIIIKTGCAAALHMTHKGFIGDHHFFTNEECWYLGPEVEFRGADLPFDNFKTPLSYTVEITGKPSHLRMQLSMDGTGKAAEMMSNANTSSADQRCALGQAFRQAGVTNPITNATAMAILDAVGPVCDMAPGVVIDDVRPYLKRW